VSSGSEADLINKTSEDDGYGAWIWIIAVLVIAAAAAAAWWFLRKKKAAGKAKDSGSPVTETLEEDELIEIEKISERPSTKIPQNRKEEANKPEMTEAVTPEEEEALYKVSGGFSVGYAQTVGARDGQEDSYGISSWNNPDVIKERGLLAVVCDGIGGLNNGQVASSAAVRMMCNVFERQNPKAEPADRLLEMVAAAQQDVLKLNRQGYKCGATLVSVLIKNNAMSLVSVGDSRIALLRGGVLMQLNREHVLARDIDETRVLTADRSYGDDRKRHAITSYIGKENLRLLDRTLTPMKLMRGDRIVLMSDGVFGTLDESVMIEALKLDPDQAARTIIEAVDARGLPYQDNATIVIVGIN